jgi:EmrB/QacA subfamily drug resistance transporter
MHDLTVSATISHDSFAYKNRWLGLLFIGISLLVVSLDNTVLNVALPSIVSSLGASTSDLQWIVDSYILVFAALLLTMGTLGDRYGRKRTLQAGLVLFAIGSLAAASATSTTALLASRAFLGIAGAAILPSTLSLISSTFSAKERPQAIALWAAVFGMGIGIGPVIGGWLIEHYEWNAVFLVNLPIILVALVGGQILIAESKDPHAPGIDIPGVILSVIGLFALVYGIVDAGSAGWTDRNVLLALLIAVIFLGAFAWWENRNPYAMLPFELFRNRSFTGANLSLILISFSLFGSVFFLSQYFQSVLGYTPLNAGLRLLPMAICLTFAASMSARLTQRLGTKRTVALGAGIAALSLLFMSMTYHVDSPYEVVIIGQILLGLGLGTATSPATNSVMGSVPVEKAGVGSAMNDTTRQLGGALGIAVLGTVLNSIYLDRIAPLLADVQATLANVPVSLVSEEQRTQALDAIRRGIQGAVIVADQIGANPLAASVAQEVRTTARGAFVEGMNHAMLIGAVIMFGSVLIVLVLLPNRVQHSSMMEIAPAEAVGD